MDPEQVTVSLNRLTEKETTPVPSPAPIFSKLHDFQLYLSSGLAISDLLLTLFQHLGGGRMNSFCANSTHKHCHRELTVGPACAENNVVSKLHAIKLGKFQARILKTQGTFVFAASGTNSHNLAACIMPSAQEPCMNSRTVTGHPLLCFPPTAAALKVQKDRRLTVLRSHRIAVRFWGREPACPAPVLKNRII